MDSFYREINETSENNDWLSLLASVREMDLETVQAADTFLVWEQWTE